MRKIILVFIISLFLSCSKDDSQVEPLCLETEVTMHVNGELQTFEALGYGISLREQGYLLQLNLDRRDNSPFREQTIVIELDYLETGKSVIDRFKYRQYIGNRSLEGDLVDHDFQNTVITNSYKCFSASFSGIITEGDQEVIITDGRINITYPNPFEVGR